MENHSINILKGTTFSDLHLLADRQPLKHFEKWMTKWQKEYDLCILNGDIFDFRWSRERDRDRSLIRAERWLRGLMEPYQRAQFVVLQGNHDSVPHYQMLLRKLQGEYEHFHWQEHWWVLGNKVFLHGDVPDVSGRMETLQQYRDHHSGMSMQSPHPIKHWVYSKATQAGLTGIIPRILPWKKQCRNTHAFLRTQLGHRYDNIQDVYLGHTHVHYSDYSHHGIRFHNCGAPLKGAKFYPNDFEFTQAEWQESVQNPLGFKLPE